MTPALEPDELLTGARFPAGRRGTVPPSSNFPAATAISPLSPRRRSSRKTPPAKSPRASLTLGGMGPAPLRASDVERALIGETIDDKRLREALRAAAAARRGRRHPRAGVLSPAAGDGAVAPRARQGARAHRGEGAHRERAKEPSPSPSTASATRRTVPVRLDAGGFPAPKAAASPARISAASTASAAPAPILFDGHSARSCLMLAVQADGHDILTVEGIAPDGQDAASAAGSVPRASRPAMRLLHAGHSDDADRAFARQPGSDRRRHPRSAFPAICAAAPATTTSSPPRSTRRSGCENST